MMQKQRLDESLVKRGFCNTIHAAQSLILAGEVVVDEHRQCSVAFPVKANANIRIKSRSVYVSRGGKKLAGALKAFQVNISGLNCVDIGSSTGGFTDCMLKSGAAHVSAIDVNYGQFHWSLRQDKRVSLFERTNVRGLQAFDIGGPFDFAASDLSFISLTAVFPDIARLLKDGAQAILLIKPQFEAVPEQIEVGGIVRDAQVHMELIEKVLTSARRNNFSVLDLCPSSIKGAKGNREYLVLLRKNETDAGECSTIDAHVIAKTVQEAFGER